MGRHFPFEPDSPGPVERRINKEYSKSPPQVSVTSLPLGGVHVDHHPSITKGMKEDTLRIPPDP